MRNHFCFLIYLILSIFLFLVSLLNWFSTIFWLLLSDTHSQFRFAAKRLMLVGMMVLHVRRNCRWLKPERRVFCGGHFGCSKMASAAVQDQLEIKFRLTDGSDIGPKMFPMAASVATLKESILAGWPKGWRFCFSTWVNQPVLACTSCLLYISEFCIFPIALLESLNVCAFRGFCCTCVAPLHGRQHMSWWSWISIDSCFLRPLVSMKDFYHELRMKTFHKKVLLLYC